ncbi:MAG: hypothetical protein BHW00_04010 [Clostridium sp. 26_22]|nr:MAG: hypothetical protein BHW00_04010 [Clostridium sp. 26_22]
MALKICKECGTEVSSKGVCPKCGKDQRNFFVKHKVITFILIVIILGIIIGVNGSGDNKSQSTPVTANETSSNNDTTAKGNTVVNVGEEIETNDTKITFVSAQDYTSYKSYSAPKTGNKVVRAEVIFENISTSDIYLSNLECYADGEKCEEYYYADDYKSPTLESLSKGKRIKSVVYYQVPVNAKSIILEYETSVWTSKKIEFKIK